jgi:hypothetical protein
MFSARARKTAPEASPFVADYFGGQGGALPGPLTFVLCSVSSALSWGSQELAPPTLPQLSTLRFRLLTAFRGRRGSSALPGKDRRVVCPLRSLLLASSFAHARRMQQQPESAAFA